MSTGSSVSWVLGKFLNTGSYKQNFVYVSKFVGRRPINLIILLTCILCRSFRELHDPPQCKSQPCLSDTPGAKPIWYLTSQTFSSPFPLYFGANTGLFGIWKSDLLLCFFQHSFPGASSMEVFLPVLPTTHVSWNYVWSSLVRRRRSQCHLHGCDVEQRSPVGADGPFVSTFLVFLTHLVQNYLHRSYDLFCFYGWVYSLSIKGYIA